MPMPASSLPPPTPSYLVFQAGRLIAEGPEPVVRPHLVDGATLVFDQTTGEPVDLPMRPPGAPLPPGPAAPSVTAPAAESSIRAAGRPATVPARPGRPKLGVVAREVTLLPGDWAWLAAQPGGASVTLRRLVLAARRAAAGTDRVRDAQANCFRFVSALAGNEPGFEEALRALFAGDGARFETCTAAWPADVRRHALRLAAPAFTAEPASAP